MRRFLDQNFLLQTETAVELYHNFASKAAIIDYHSHLPPDEIAEDKNYENLTAIWLKGDHYKWRAMRTFGIPEKYITGEASDFEKFQKWAETVPHTLRNPLFHWTHMELRNPFGIEDLLNPSSAGDIYDKCTAMLSTSEFSCRELLRKMNVEVVCTTDDPIDDLVHHQKIKEDGFEIKVLPTFRPDKSLAVENPRSYNDYLDRLAAASGITISKYSDLLEALYDRHDYFHLNGCRLSDHGMETVYVSSTDLDSVNNSFQRLRSNQNLNLNEIQALKSHLLVRLAQMDHDKGWIQQFHLGALRNNNSRMMAQLGTDSGFDSMGDFEMARPLSRFLDRLDSTNQLAKTIIYNLNPRDNELIASMIGNFNDGSARGKIQFGTAWWFLDQKLGMENQINVLSNMGLLSCFVGMVTDSRSFLSYPRHAYFRRILCNLIGNDVENGELPYDLELLGSLVSGVCHKNAQEYFGF